MRLWLKVWLLCCVTQAMAATQLPAEWPTRPQTLAPPEHRRGLEQTWLSVPEWSRVFAPADYAEYLRADGKPSAFPWMAHVGQLWGSYGAATRAQIADARAAANPGYHLKDLAIASGTSLEYGLRAAYELTAGRLAELTRSTMPTAEEILAGKVAQDYAYFIRHRPGHEFDFIAPLKALWCDTGWFGADLPRKWERKYALTTEYLAKAIYGFVARLAARAGTADDKPTTAVVVDRWLDRLDGVWPEMQRLKSYPTGGQLVLLPRHAAFSPVATAIARSGADFVEIAGNGPDAPILLSVIARSEWQPSGSVLQRQPVVTRPGESRVVFSVPVKALASTLRGLDAAGLRAEHLYDY